MRAPWFRCDARIGKDPRVAKLRSDSARWAFVLTMGEAKVQRPQGAFPSADHLAAALGSHGRYVSDLLSVGLLRTLDDGSVVLPRWVEWQSDLDLSTPRVRRLRALKRDETA